MAKAAAFRPPLAHKVHITHSYTPAAGTDIRKTFARVRREQAEAAEAARRQPELFDAQIVVDTSRKGSTQ